MGYSSFRKDRFIHSFLVTFWRCQLFAYEPWLFLYKHICIQCLTYSSHACSLVLSDYECWVMVGQIEFAYSLSSFRFVLFHPLCFVSLVVCPEQRVYDVHVFKTHSHTRLILFRYSIMWIKSIIMYIFITSTYDLTGVRYQTTKWSAKYSTVNYWLIYIPQYIINVNKNFKYWTSNIHKVSPPLIKNTIIVF